MLRAFRCAHDRDLGLGPELGDDPARFVARTLEPRPAVDEITRGERVVDHEYRGLRSARDLRAFALARREWLRERDRDREAREGAHEQDEALAELEPARGLALRSHQEVERRERHDPGAPP